MNESERLKKNPNFDKLDLRNEEVFIGLYDYFAPRLLRHAYVRLSNNEEAKDTVAQVFLKAWEYLRERNYNNKPIRNVRAFLYQMVNNQIIDLYRKKSRTEISLENLEPLKAMLVDSNPFVKNQYQFDTEKALEAASCLREDYKRVLLWRYLDELSIGEISEILNKSRGSVSVILYRALRDLKNILKEKGF